MTRFNYSLKAFQITFFILFTSFIISCNEKETIKNKTMNSESVKIPMTIVIHGGAGEIKRGLLTSEEEEEYRSKMKEALNSGYSIIENGGDAIEAVVATIQILEDSPLFNAGKGSVLTHEGDVSMDASIMNGEDINAGAVSGIKHVKNPIQLARLVMDSSQHVFLSGEGAEQFADKQHLEKKENDYFITPKRLKQLKRVLGEDSDNSEKIIDKHGTVGCVVIDAKGNLAAGTSTGGMVNKEYGRIGDSPIIGAGTFADNGSCAVSATGHGEYFIRLSVARNIADLMKYKDLSLEEASKEVIQHQLADLGGSGGIIAVDKKGNFCFEFNTPGMYRAVKQEGKEEEVFFYEKMD